jgi:hypothetical protein
MKRVLFLAVLVLAVSAVPAKADPACTNASQVVGPSAISSCSFGGLTFGSFSGANAGGVPNPLVVAVNFSTNASGDVLITFNPNLTNPVQDLFFFFTVTGGIDGINLEVGGRNANINEVACSVPFSISGFCANQNTLVNLVAGSGFSDSGSFATTSPVYIFKDINVQPGGSLTDFGQSFATPEPGTLTLFGAGLISIAGLIRRKLKK